MLETLKNTFKTLSIVLLGSLIATAYTGMVSVWGFAPIVISEGFAALSIFIGLIWSVITGIYIPWVFIRSYSLWQKLEILAYNAELPVEQRVAGITPLA